MLLEIPLGLALDAHLVAVEIVVAPLVIRRADVGGARVLGLVAVLVEVEHLAGIPVFLLVGQVGEADLERL
ncbi:hypothetical protein [Luteimonas dalianensis]|uniref:hypothetical protein n=1 Tax=Luteimonas dalianensis TaxID=1148196 RepID=UPI003BF604C1